MAESNSTGLSEEKKTQLLKGEPLVSVSYLENDIIHATGAIFVKAQRETIWDILADYNHLSETIPKVVESKLVEENGNEKIIDQTGRSGILFIQQSAHLVLRVTENFPRSLAFDLIEGDFKVYNGCWYFESSQEEEGTFVGWQAKLQPDFFAPPFLVSFVQHQDLPKILRAIKELAENKALQERIS